MKKLKKLVTLATNATNPDLKLPRIVVLLGLATKLEFEDNKDKFRSISWQGHSARNVNKLAYLLSDGTGKKVFLATNARILLQAQADKGLKNSKPGKLLKRWADYDAENALKLNIKDGICRKKAGTVFSIEYQSQKWSGSKWATYRHDFEQETFLYLSENGSLYGIMNKLKKKIVTDRGLVG